MSSITETPTQILPSAEFDCGTTTATPDVQTHMHRILAEALHHHLDIEKLCRQAKTASYSEANDLLQQIHDAASILFLQWSRYCHKGESLVTLATARLFNGLTRDARLLHERFNLFDTTHLDKFKSALESMPFGGSFESEQIAAEMDKAAKAHTHERAWAWVVLPTFARQPYGRILLFKAEIANFEHPIFVTQPFFLEGRATLFHTHGQNWAYSRPLGAASGRNVHINTLWMPRQSDDPFPMNLEDLAEYCSGEVAIVPPRLIHGISRKRCSSLQQIPTLSDMLQDRERCQTWIDQCRFGELACLHAYCPDPNLNRQLKNSPFVQENSQFFIEYDMIVFDHFAESIWCGGGGSWPRRMIEFGTTGEHCGACFEDDPRKENLDPQTVSDWFVASPAPKLVKFSIGCE